VIHFLVITTLGYLVLLILLAKGVTRLNGADGTAKPTVSILVAARNEESHITACLDALLQQDYPAEKLEIIAIDDGSDDNTADIIRQYQEKDRRVHLVTAGANPEGLGPKKNALRWGIRASQGDILVTTDADCTPPETWLSTIISYFQDSVGVVAGPSVLIGKRNWLTQWLVLENLGNIAIYAGSTGLGVPLGAQGANLAYRRRVWDALGFGQHGKTFSGDDDLFVQRVANDGTWDVRYALNPSASVPHHHRITGRSTVQQKHRHLSAVWWYRKDIIALAAFVTLYHLLLAAGFLVGLFSMPIFSAWLGVTAIKTLSDGLILNRIAHKLHVTLPWKWLPIAEVLRPWAMVILVPWSWVAPVSWKGRIRSAAPVPNTGKSL
jgi:glycosyltransferase involved in cell wall biosynthesis